MIKFMSYVSHNKDKWEDSHCGLAVTNPTSIHERIQVQSLALLSGLKIQCCCELWCRSQMQLGSCVAVAVA